MQNLKNEAGNLLPKVFTFNPANAPIRVQVINQEPYFVAKDICDALDIKDTEVSMRKLDDDERLMRKVYASGQNRDMWLVNESGLYNLIFRSNKPEARVFRKWVTSEVLPAIRKTGSYEISKPAMGRPRRGELINADILNLLWLIGESLHHGDQKEVAIELGVSVQSISRVLNGYQRSNRILSALYSRAKKKQRVFYVVQPAGSYGSAAC